MNRRTLAAVAVAALVLLAGCGGTVDVEDEGGSPSPSKTASPSPSPTASPTPTPSLADVSMPPGVTKEGITDVDALLSAHKKALEGTSATVSMDFELSVNGSGQDVSFYGKYTPDDDEGWMRVELQDGTGVFYTKDGTTYKKVTKKGVTKYGTTDKVSAIPEEPRFGADFRIRDAITGANWTAEGVVVRNGTTLIKLVATDVDLPESVNVSGDTDVTSEGVLLVSPQGVVHEVSIRTRVVSGDKTVVYAIDVELTDIGSTTISEPEWVERAAN